MILWSHCLIIISSDQIYEQLKALKPSKSAGPDGIHPKFLKEAAIELSKPLTLIYRMTPHRPVDWMLFQYSRRAIAILLKTIVLFNN